MVRGTCSPLSGDFVRSSRVRHVVGTIAIKEITEHFAEGSLVMRTANRILGAMQKGVAQMNVDNKSLFTGLVIGDDRLQSREMVQRFRESGLSHLCAASGQNVAYLLAMATPLMRRRSARVKWLITVCIIGWFVVLTRAEPSVLRAGFMAAAVATNALRRHPMNARSVLAVSVICLLFIDPMLAWSIGFALSVGATAGLAWLSSPLGKICGGRGVLASTLAAQLGTLPVSLVVFGSVPVISLIANPLALPVAGAVMTVGLPLSLLAAAFPWLVGPVSLALSAPVAWVDGVAHIASRVSPTSHANSALWIVVALWVVARWVRKKGRRPTAVAG
jgi:competence protein ComEC